MNGRSENQLPFLRKFIALSRQRVNTLLSDFRSRKLKFGDRDHAIFLGEYGSPTAPLALGREMAVIRAYRETRRSVIAVTTFQIMHSFMPTLTLHGRANAWISKRCILHFRARVLPQISTDLWSEHNKVLAHSRFSCPDTPLSERCPLYTGLTRVALRAPKQLARPFRHLTRWRYLLCT